MTPVCSVADVDTLVIVPEYVTETVAANSSGASGPTARHKNKLVGTKARILIPMANPGILRKISSFPSLEAASPSVKTRGILIGA
jgi:hypothetical protein